MEFLCFVGPGNYRFVSLKLMYLSHQRELGDVLGHVGLPRYMFEVLERSLVASERSKLFFFGRKKIKR